MQRLFFPICIAPHLPMLNLFSHPVTLQSHKLFCVVLVNCCLYYSEYLIMRKLAHLLFYVLMGMLHVWGGKCIENKAKIWVHSHIPVILFSGAASTNPCGNTLQQNVIAKSKDQNKKISRATGRPRKDCQGGETALYLPISTFSCCPEDAPTSAQRSWWVQGELWPKAELQDVAAEFQQERDTTNLPTRARDFWVFLLKTPAGISPELIQKTERTPTLSYLYAQWRLGPIHSEVHMKSWFLLCHGRKTWKALQKLWSSTGKGTALKQTSVSFLLWL